MTYQKFIESFGDEPSYHLDPKKHNEYCDLVNHTLKFLWSMNDICRLHVYTFRDFIIPYKGELCYLGENKV